jgi:hypothetical protein
MKKIFLLTCVLFFIQNGFNQEILKSGVFCSPSVSVGYTFGAKFNIGFSIDVGKHFNMETNPAYGISFSYYLIKMNKGLHKQKSISTLIQNDFAKLKVGVGRMVNGWGYNKVNKCKVNGIATDFSVNTVNFISPSLGFKSFYYKKRNWSWFNENYHSLYIGVNHNINEKTSYLRK